MSGLDWALIIGASFWGVLVIGLCFVLVSVFRLVSEVADLVHGISSQTVPLLDGLNETVSGVNVELARIDTIIAGVQSITDTTDSLVGIVHATVSNPMIKAAAYAAGAARSYRAMSESSAQGRSRS